ncbi:MAG TPA: FG-GAP-like repeat-containing protein [Acidobacteriaceae bacterium]|jgi:hypothetical protein|nr:FG-GAP-like repeat-containing protein [Acidobacteriaceae bacterium]
MTVLLAVAGVLAVALPVRVALGQGTKATTSTMTVTGPDPYSMNCTVGGPWVAPGKGPTGAVTFTDATATQAIGTAMLPSAPQAALFGAPIYSPAAGQLIATGDFNRDGIPDVVLADTNSFALIVLLGKGNGTFQTAVSYPLPPPGDRSRGYGGIAAGDFAGNGKLSVAVTIPYASETGPAVAIVPGNGDGTFQTAKIYPVGNGPMGIVTGYFNSDKHLDLAVANAKDGTVSILLGNGDGTFGAQTTYAASRASSIVAEDFNGDGNVDLVAGDGGAAQVEFLAGNGDGTFQPEVFSSTGVGPVFNLPTYMAAGDFNQDGIPDLAVAGSTAERLSILIGSGTGTFTIASSTPLAANAQGLAAGDFTGTGIGAVAVSLESGSEQVWFGDGNGGLAFEESQDLTYPYGVPGAVVTGDFNGDGIPDLAVDELNNVTTLLDTKAGSIASLSNVVLDAGITPKHYLHCTYGGDTNYAGSAGYTNVTIPATATPNLSLFSGTYRLPTSLSVTDPMGSANIYFTENGTKPNSSSNLYTGPIALAGRETIKAIGYAPGFLPSGVETATYTQQAATPAITPAAGTWAAGTTITITDLPTKGTIHYTTNGTTPTGNSPIYKVPFTLTSSETVQAIAFSPAMLVSGVGSAMYTIGSAATPAPVITPGSEGFKSAPTVKITDTISGAAIYYTTNGSTPTASSPVYGGPFTLPTNGYPVVMVKAVAIASGEAASTVTANRFTMMTTTSTLIVSGSDPYSLKCSVAGPAVAGISGPTGTVTFTDVTTSQTLGTASLKAATAGLRFATPVSSTAGGAIVVGDFNGDGIRDIVFAEGGADLEALEGNGDGTFQSPVPSPTGGIAADSMVTGDFNGDGKLDIAFMNGARDGAYVALGNGNETFQTPILIYSTANAQHPIAIAAGDFAGNGFADVAITNEIAGTVTIAWGNSANPLQTETTMAAGTKPGLVVADDFNNDQRPDLAIATTTGIEVLLNNGDGTFQAPLTMNLGFGPQAVLAREINKDGLLDLVVDQGGTKAWVLLGNGDGTFGLLSGSGVPLTGTLLSADFNGDGNSDLAGANANETSIALGNGDGTFQTPVGYPMTGTLAATADFNQDGRYDIAFGAMPSGADVQLSYAAEIAPGIVASATVNAGTTAKHQLECSYAGDGNYNGSVSSVVTKTYTAAAVPTFSPGTNSYSTAQTVTLSDTTANTTIYYTTDNSTPTTSSTPYTGAITVSKTTTVKAIAADVAHLPSAVGEAVYTITP